MLSLLNIVLSMSLVWGSGNTLRSLKDVSVKTFDISQPSLFVVFQKDCEACQKQVHQLSCIDVPIYLVGAFSSEKALRKEYRKMKTKYPAFMSTKAFLKQLGVTQGLTPQLIYTGKSKRTHFLGLTGCQDLKNRKLKGA